MKYITRVTLLITKCLLIFGIISCNDTRKNTDANDTSALNKDSLQSYVDQRLDIYETVKLTTNLNDLTTSERKILPLLIRAAQIMDNLFLKQS